MGKEIGESGCILYNDDRDFSLFQESPYCGSVVSSCLSSIDNEIPLGRMSVNRDRCRVAWRVVGLKNQKKKSR